MIARRSQVSWLAGLALLSLTTCTDAPHAPEVRLQWAEAPGGGGGPKVRQADPAEGEQTQTLDVRIIGSGFEDGSDAQWELDGAPSPDVVTNSTQFVSDRELLANISISGTAPLARYDIAVTTPRGKKGVGIEKFEVKSTGQPVPSSDEPATFTYQELDVHSDGNAVYRHDEDCTTSAFVQNDTVNAQQVARQWLPSAKGRKQTCRQLLIRLHERVDPVTGVVTSVPPVLDAIENLAIHVEGPAAGRGKLNFPYCMGGGRGMRFNPDTLNFGIAGSTHLKVDTLELGRSWRVYSDETTVAGCWVDGEKNVGVADTTYWRVEVDFIVTKDPLSP